MARTQVLTFSQERPWRGGSWSEFDFVKERSRWLYLIRCKTCGQHWYLFAKTDTADYYLYRMKPEEVEAAEKDIWPKNIDAFNQPLDAMWFRK